jgi:hypothetical protein
MCTSSSGIRTVPLRATQAFSFDCRCAFCSTLRRYRRPSLGSRTSCWICSPGKEGIFVGLETFQPRLVVRLQHWLEPARRRIGSLGSQSGGKLARSVARGGPQQRQANRKSEPKSELGLHMADSTAHSWRCLRPPIRAQGRNRVAHALAHARALVAGQGPEGLGLACRAAAPASRPAARSAPFPRRSSIRTSSNDERKCTVLSRERRVNRGRRPAAPEAEDGPSGRLLTRGRSS